ncbi:MAG TPA: glycosyltransferase 87 family protein, partial [Gaiellaceae bacterium]|nr:glycosyltransferase 87 family protein [Gaiellaceae bacterium]
YAAAFKWTMALLGAGSVALLVAVLASIRASRPRIVGAAVAAGVAPLVAGRIFLNAYDLWPAFLVAAALLAFVRRHERAVYVLLALGVAAKVYPVVLLPLALVESWERGGRDLVRRGLAWFAGVLVLVHVPFAIAGPGGLRYSYWIQLKRGLEIESFGGSILLVLNRLGLYHVTAATQSPSSTDVVGSLADVIGALSTVLELGAVLLVAWLFWRRRRDRLVAAAAAVLGFIAFGKVFSPQYVDWLVPLVPAAGPVAAAGTLVVAGLTHGVFDRFSAPGGPNGLAYKNALAWWVFARNLVVLALYGLLVARLARRPRSSSP